MTSSSIGGETGSRRVSLKHPLYYGLCTTRTSSEHIVAVVVVDVIVVIVAMLADSSAAWQQETPVGRFVG
jgi:hypothetical protein